MQGGTQTVGFDSRTQVKARTKQRFAPAAIQSLEVLALPVSRLTTYIDTMVEQNPLLDFDQGESFIQFEELPSEQADEAEEVSAGEVSDFESYRPRMRGEFTAFDFDRLQDSCMETETLHSYLRLQLAQYSYAEKDEELAHLIIENINDDGYFVGSLPFLCDLQHRELDEGERLLKDIQSLSPRGVGARDVGECLLLQISQYDEYSEILETLLKDGLDDLAHNRTTLLLKKYKLSTQQLSGIKNAVKALNPRPGSEFYQQQKTTYIIPDLLVTKKGSSFSVTVAGEVAESLTINDEYLELLSRDKVDDATTTWISSKHEEAQLFLKNINQRKQTLYRFGLFLLENQYEFFCFGESRVKPMTMQQVADALDLHVSTVSRTVQDKYILTGWGTYPLKYFFSSAIGCTRSERKSSMSSLAIKNRIRELVEKEDRSKPLSDASLTSLLNEEGIEIKRRTVAKYREALGINKQSQRRFS